MNKKYKIALLSISVLLFGSIFLGTSYSLWQSTNIQEGTNEVKVGCFRITYTNLASYGGETAGDINLVNTYPLSDENGASLTPYMFNIKNECSIASDYIINLETLNTSNFNTDYLRLKFNNVNNVTNNNSAIYTSLEQGTIILASESNDARLLYSGHLEENQDATFSLRVWIDKSATVDTPNVMGKTWNGKVVVNAQAAKPKGPAYEIESGDLDTVGSIVKIANEEFYVIGQEDDTHVKLLSKWNLNVGDNAKGTATKLQDEDVRGYRKDEGTMYGNLAFSTSQYWFDSENLGLKQEYGTDYSAYVYDSNSVLYQHVENYVAYLKNEGVNVTGRLINLEELIELGCNRSVGYCDAENGGTAPEWVYQTTYWTGVARNNSDLWAVSTFGYFDYHYYSISNMHGVRPVIILKK